MKTIILILCLGSFMNTIAQTTHILLTRHAEKELNGMDPNLTREGRARANALSQLKKDYDIQGIYSSNFRRTIQTAMPLVNSLEIEMNTSISPVAYSAYLEDILGKFKGKSVLVVGHNNTVPALVNYIMDKQIIWTIPEDDFSNLFIIKIEGNEPKSLKHYRYNVGIDGELELKRL